MAEMNNDETYFSEQTKLNYRKNILKPVEFFLLSHRAITQEQLGLLVYKRMDHNVIILAFGPTPVPPPYPSELFFEGNTNHERTLFKTGSTVTFEYDGNLREPTDASSDQLQLPEADFPFRQNKFKTDLKASVDKKLTLIFCNKSEIKIEIPRVICKNKKIKNKYRHKLEWPLEMGAKKVIYSNNEFFSEYLNVLKIESKTEYEEEIYIRGQIGAFEDKKGKRRKEDQGNIETFERHIQCGQSIFKIDYYDLYVYEIVGLVCDQKSMYYDPVVPKYPNQADYKSLIDEIDSDAALIEFFRIFSNLIEGNFCRFTSDKERIMQLCLALIYAEPIRNFQAIGWNKLILDHAKYIVSDRDLRDVLKNHPMVTGGSFKGRLTGYYGTTEAASSKVAAFKLKLNKLKDDFDTIGLPERQQNDDDNQDLPVSYRS